MDKVSIHLSQAFDIGANLYPKLLEDWIKISIHMGALLPESATVISLQRIGRLDLVIRAIEDEIAELVSDKDIEDPFPLDSLSLFSEMWIASTYEVFRMYRARHLLEKTIAFESIHHKLRLLRITQAKSEIALDRQHLEDPLMLIKVGIVTHPGERYVYSTEDPERAHILPAVISNDGSIQWQVIDLLNDETYWVRRRELSDEILSYGLSDEVINK